MIRLLVIFLLMVVLMAAGWQLPNLFDWSSPEALHMALRASFLICIGTIAGLLALNLRNPFYGAVLAVWLWLGTNMLAETPKFLAFDAVGQAFLLLLWIEVAIRSERWSRLVAGIGATVHGSMWAIGLTGKALDPGFVAAAPDVLLRAFGWPGALVIYCVPAVGIVAASWVMERVR